MPGALGARRERDVAGRDHVFATVLAPTPDCKTSPRVAVKSDVEDLDRLADDKAIRRQLDVVLEGSPQRPELLVVTMSIGEDCF